MWKDVPKPPGLEEVAETKTFKMDDEGTRYKHLTDLLGEWETGMEICNRGIPNGVRPVDHLEKSAQLFFAIKYLKTYIDYTSGFKDPMNQYKLTKTIRQAHSEETFGGRG